MTQARASMPSSDKILLTKLAALKTADEKLDALAEEYKLISYQQYVLDFFRNVSADEQLVFCAKLIKKHETIDYQKLRILVDIHAANADRFEFADVVLSEFPAITAAQMEALDQFKQKGLVRTLEDVRDSDFVRLTKNHNPLPSHEFMGIYRMASLVDTKPYFQLVYNLAAFFRNELALQQIHHLLPPKTHEDFIDNNDRNVEFMLLRLIHYFFVNKTLEQKIPVDENTAKSKFIVEKATPELVEEVIIHALMNLKSYLKNRPIWLHKNNFLKLFFVSMLVTTKKGNDLFFNNKYQCGVFGNFNLQSLSAAELEFKKGVNWTLWSIIERDDREPLSADRDYVRMQLCLEAAPNNNKVGFEFAEFDAAEIEAKAAARKKVEEPNFIQPGNPGVQYEGDVYPELADWKPDDISSKEKKVSPALVILTGSTHQTLRQLQVAETKKKPEVKSISEEEKTKLDQEKKAVEEKLFAELDKKFTEKFDPKVTTLTKLEFALFTTIKDSKASNEAKKILVAIQQCRAIERKKGTPDEEIRPSVNVDDDKDLTPLCYAMRKRNRILVMELLKADADPSIASYERFRDWVGSHEIPLEVALREMPDLVDVFLKKNLDNNVIKIALNHLAEEVQSILVNKLHTPAQLRFLNHAFDRNLVEYPEKTLAILKHIKSNIPSKRGVWIGIIKTIDEMIKKLDGKKDPVFKPKVKIFWEVEDPLLQPSVTSGDSAPKPASVMRILKN